MAPCTLTRLFVCVFLTAHLQQSSWAQTCTTDAEEVAVEAGNAFSVWLRAESRVRPGPPDWSHWARTIPLENMLDSGVWMQDSTNGNWRRRVQLIAFDTGQLYIPPMPLPIPPATMCTLPELGILVVAGASLDGLGQLADIKDIHRTDNAPSGWQSATVLAALLVLMLAAGYAILRKKKSNAEQPPLSRQPDAILVELDRLDRNHPKTGEQTAAFYTRISFLLRLLLQENTGLPALQTPMNEWVFRLPETLADQTRALLEQCELVKFAKYHPPSDAHGAAISTAKKIARQIIQTPQSEA